MGFDSELQAFLVQDGGACGQADAEVSQKWRIARIFRAKMIPYRRYAQDSPPENVVMSYHDLIKKPIKKTRREVEFTPGSQAWRREAFGYPLRVYQIDNGIDKGWQGEIHMQSERRVIRTTVFPDLAEAQWETCQCARRLAGLPETHEMDPCGGGSGVWEAFTDSDYLR
jgi:hypothetical protein